MSTRSEIETWGYQSSQSIWILCPALGEKPKLIKAKYFRSSTEMPCNFLEINLRVGMWTSPSQWDMKGRWGSFVEVRVKLRGKILSW